MSNTKYQVKVTTQFKKDYTLAMKRGLKITLLETIISMLARGETLPEKNRDHALTGRLGRLPGMPHSTRLAAGLPH